MADFKLRYIIDADGRRARSELDGVDKAIDKLSRRGRSGGGLGDVFGGNLASDAFSKLSSLLLEGGGALVDYSAKLEQTKLSFETLMGGAEAAAKHLEELRKLSTSTPLEFQSITKMSQRLQGAGIAAQQVTALIKDIGNTAAATGDMTADRMEGIGVAISQVFAKGKVSAEEMEQLAERGIPAWRILSSELGKSVGETRKLAEEGKITSQQFLESFQKFTRLNFGDAMEKQAGTFGGAMAKVTNLVQVASESAFSSWFREISTIAVRTSSELEKQKGDFKQMGSTLGQAAGQAFGISFRDASMWLIRDLAGMMAPVGGQSTIGDTIRGFFKGLFGERLPSSGMSIGDLRRGDDNLGTPRANPFGGVNLNPGTTGGTGGRSRSSSSDSRTDKEAYQDFVKALKSLGVTINSGFRTFKQQQDLYNRLPRGQAARPGTSDHEFWRAVDLPPGVSDDILQRAANIARVTLEKRNVHQGTGLHNHQGFRKGLSMGGGEEQIAQEMKERAEKEREATELTLNETREGLEKEYEMREAAADRELALLEASTLAGIRTEEDAAAERMRIEERLMQFKLEQLESYLEVATHDEKEFARVEQQIALHRERMETQIIQNRNQRDELAMKRSEREIELAGKQAEKVRELFEIEEKRRQAERDYVMSQISQPDTDHMSAGSTPFSRGAFGGMWDATGNLGKYDEATGKIIGLESVMKSLGQTASDVFMQMGAGLGQMLESWVLLGDQADVSMQKMVATVLAGVASQAATLSIFHLAMGIAALTPWGAMLYGPAPLHFKAAAIWGGVAVGTAIGGRLIAGNSFQQEGGGRSSAGSSGSGFSGSSTGGDRDLSPISRVTEDAYISGRRPDEGLIRVMEKLNQKITAMRAGDVLAAGVQQRRGLITRTVASEIGRNSSAGTRILKHAGVR